jgi:ATP-binding protein involved in chromosome partitioning
LIENMSTHICSNCGHIEHIFGHGGVTKEAKKLGAPLLAEIPLHIDIRTTSDGGAPIVVSRSNSEHAGIFRTLARHLIATGQA